MEDLSPRMDELIRQLQGASSEAELGHALDGFRELTELDWYLFAISRISSLRSSGHKVFTNAESWMTAYQKEMLQEADPVVKYIAANHSAVRWDNFEHLDGYNSSEQLAVMQRARDHGLHAGFSIPCSSFGNFAVFSMADSEERAKERFNTIIPYAHMFASHLLESVLRLDCATAEKSAHHELTSREVECLYWGAEGKTAWEIGKILGVSERTVVFHFANATRKLGASNRQHAVSKGSRLNKYF